MSTELDQAALDYHRYPKPGKIEISATKYMLNQRDLELAYSPGVAAAALACLNLLLYMGLKRENVTV